MRKFKMKWDGIYYYFLYVEGCGLAMLNNDGTFMETMTFEEEVILQTAKDDLENNDFSYLKEIK